MALLALLETPASGSPTPTEYTVSPQVWIAFLVFVALLLLFDLVVLHRDDHEIGFREAVRASVGWIVLSLAFGLVVWWGMGSEAAGQYYAGYLIEKSLSVDNVFVWAVVLSYFAVPRNLQHRVLFWGVFGALVMRAIFIVAGVALLQRLEWLVFVFGAFLLFTGVRVARHSGGDVHPERNPLLRLMRRRVPMTSDYRGSRFFIRENGRRFATPLLAVLVVVEATDVVFAVDSIPAILAISRSTFIVFSSNVFAILGLRALYFVLAGAKDRLVYLNVGLGTVLCFVGVKMLAERWVHVPVGLSLAIVAAILTVTVVVSLRATPNDPLAGSGPEPDPAHDPADTPEDT